MISNWKPIEPLSDEDRSFDLKDIESLGEAWAEVKTKLGETSKGNLEKFSEKLARLWSIETGILERLYDIDRGTTAILVEQGLLASYIDRSGTDQDPESLIEILKDHRAAVKLIHDCVADSRPLTIGFIHELHNILTQHQTSVSGVDQFGKRVSFPLLHGGFKKSPNNPTRHNGTVHEYCPPIHVASEMDRLMALYYEYDGENNPLLVSAWLHHRFEQIHPYQDGNGRVGRALSNLVLVKAGLFPVVVRRDHRAEYIQALEEADIGNLHSLTRLFADIQRKTILEAISVAPDTKPTLVVVPDIADAIGLKFQRKKEESDRSLLRVNEVADVLQAEVRKYLLDMLNDVNKRIEQKGDLDIGVQVLLGGPGQLHKGQPTEHWYRRQVIETARQANQRVNFEQHHYFVRGRLSSEGIPWLTYVVSFHHVGEKLSGVMEVTAFAYISNPLSDEESPRSNPIQCMDRPFTITFKDNPNEIKQGLLEWVHESFALALKEWGEVVI